MPYQTLPKIPSGVASLLASANNPPTKLIVPLKMDTCSKPPYLSMNAPLTGGPTRTANDATPIPIPIYVPKFCGLSVQREMAVEAEETIVPEQNPKKAEYTMIAALDVGKLTQKIIIPVAIPANANMFCRPSLSASMPGMIRPKVDVALMIASRYAAKATPMPRDTAYVVM